MARPRKFPIRHSDQPFIPSEDEYKYLVSNAEYVFGYMPGVKQMVKIAKPEAMALRRADDNTPPRVIVEPPHLIVGET